MSPATFLLLLVLAPLFEIYLFIHIGGAIGAVPTLLIVILTAVIGAGVIRGQGIATAFRYRSAIARGESPAFELLESFILLVGGALLLVPGFLTDTIGAVCLLRVSRVCMVRYILHQLDLQVDPSRRRKRSPDAINVKFRGRDIDD